MNNEKLLQALDNDSNAHLLQFTTHKINSMKHEILSELDLSSELFIDYMTKLRDYRYVDEMNDLRIGTFIRWIPITDPNNVYLTMGGIVCNLKITETGMNVTCKNFAHKFFQFKMDECLIFQKMTGQEQVLLAALDHLSK